MCAEGCTIFLCFSLFDVLFNIWFRRPLHLFSTLLIELSFIEFTIFIFAENVNENYPPLLKMQTVHLLKMSLAAVPAIMVPLTYKPPHIMSLLLIILS